MRVIICGAGQVGFNIARHLSDLHHDVTVIDRSAQLIRKVGESLDVQALTGHASDPNMLDKADAADADMLIAVTMSDEVNMVACQVAHSLFNVPTKIARVRNQAYLLPAWRDLFTRDNLPIDVTISPELEVAEAVFRRLEVPGAFDMIPFAEGKVRVIGAWLTENCPVVDTPLRQLTELFPDLKVRIMAVLRGEKTFVPSSDDHLEVGDGIYFAVAQDQIGRAMAAFGHEEVAARRVVIVGGGNVGLFLAKTLEERDPKVNVKIIEHSESQANLVAEELKRAIVLHGDALDTEILREANVREAETIVAVANDDEVNILACILAKRLGCSRAIALLNNVIYRPLTASLGIDVHVDPRETTVSTILQHIRRGRIRALHAVRDGAAEIIEAEALDTSPLVGKSLKEVKLPKGVIVGAIMRDNQVIIPRSSTVFEAHDRVIILTTVEAVKKVEQLFTVRLEFF